VAWWAERFDEAVQRIVRENCKTLKFTKFRQASEVMTAVYPCLMTSPLSVSQLIRPLTWIRSDGKLRTNDELADEMFAALPLLPEILPGPYRPSLTTNQH
jgi:hypothetical protein